MKRRKSFFHDFFSRSMTWEYRGLLGLTGVYKGLQEVTRGYKGLQGVIEMMDYPVCKNVNFAFFLNPCLYCPLVTLCNSL